MSGSIHSGHFMVSRLDDDEDDDNNDPADDSSESERDNAQSVEIDIHNPDSVADAAKNLELNYGIDSPSTKDEQVTSWNDLDRPPTKRLHKQNQYLTYYTNTSSTFKAHNQQQQQQQNQNQSHEQQDGQQQVSIESSGDSGARFSAVALDARLLPGNDGLASPMVAPTNLVLSDNNSSANNNNNINTLSSVAIQQQQQQQRLQLQQQQQQQQQNRVMVPNAFSIGTSSSTASLAAQGAPASVVSPSAAAAILNEASRRLQLQQRHQQQQQQMQLAAAAVAAHGQHAHQVTIDTSLTKLLQCMSLYYSSKLTSPKWKSFKGLKLRLKYKIRLNNLIWRAWFLQYIRGRRPPGCQFVAPAETDVHKKSETIVLEGKYWKRKEKAIVDEYKKWRIFNIHKQKNQLHCFRPVSKIMFKQNLLFLSCRKAPIIYVNRPRLGKKKQ